MNIGVLEDNPAILDYMTIALEMAGHHVQTFTSSTPLIDRLLTNSEIYGPLPYDVIVVTAGVKEELAHVQAALPDVPILHKPFKMSDLLRLIDDLQAA